MVIKDIKIVQNTHTVTLSATCKIRKIGWDTVYFKLTSGSRKNISTDASPFAAALLLPSMMQGEELRIHGSISRQLYQGMHAIMDEVLQWNMGYKRIKIHVDAVISDKQKPTQTASFFSGGVDSFYTYLKHKHDSVKSHRVNNLILVNGFDIELHDTPLWNLTRDNIQAIATAEDITLVTVESNIRPLLEPILPWGYAHGGCLAAVGLFLRSAFRRIYIPSSFALAEQIPWGSHARLDMHWSTEVTRFIHDGTEARRIDKVSWQIAQSPLALKHLKVCYFNPHQSYNCGNCEKCLRTMVSLYAAGVLEDAVTFPSQIDVDRVATLPKTKGEGEVILYGEEQNLAALKAKNLNPALQEALSVNIAKTIALQTNAIGTLRAFTAKLIRLVVYIDHTYSRGYAYAAWRSLARKNISRPLKSGAKGTVMQNNKV